MKSVSYFKSLPELLPKEDLYSEFLEALDIYGRGGYKGSVLIKIFLELSDRQWNSYLYMDAFLKGKVEDVLLSLWDGTDLEYVEGVIAISARLGLVRLFEFLSSRKACELSGEVSVEIASAIAELGKSISDPYSGMG